MQPNLMPDLVSYGKWHKCFSKLFPFLSATLCLPRSTARPLVWRPNRRINLPHASETRRQDSHATDPSALNVNFLERCFEVTRIPRHIIPVSLFTELNAHAAVENSMAELFGTDSAQPYSDSATGTRFVISRAKYPGLRCFALNVWAEWAC